MGNVFCARGCILENADASECYERWPIPTMIHVDGPYGIGGFSGDPSDYRELPSVYFEHIAAWTRKATAQTTLWFWGTELGWATVHPLLDDAGWEYQELSVWDKGLSHIAGNVNSKTIRGIPVVTEVCVRYALRPMMKSPDGSKVCLKQWMRDEWQRSGLPLNRANEACGVKNAATRKYLTLDDKWYFPPAEAVVAMSTYLMEHGAATEVPYFSLDGKNVPTVEQWSALRPKWNHEHGMTNVWRVPQLMTRERIRGKGAGKTFHHNQKPRKIIEYLIRTSTDPGDVIWDPFAGTATVACAAGAMDRRCYAAEISLPIYEVASQRMSKELLAHDGGLERKVG